MPILKAIQERSDHINLLIQNKNGEQLYEIAIKIDSWEPGRKALSIRTDDAVRIAPVAANGFNLIL